VLSRAFLKMILQEAEPSQVQPKILQEADGSVTVTLEPLDIAVNAGSKEAAIQEAANEASSINAK